MKKMAITLLCITLFTVSCSPGSLKDFRHEGESVCRDIVDDLERVETREDLARLEPFLKKHFEKLASIIIEAREFQIKYPEEALAFQGPQEAEVSEIMKEELQRIYRIEGGKEIVERAQRESMLRLDAFEKMKEKHKELRIK